MPSLTRKTEDLSASLFSMSGSRCSIVREKRVVSMITVRDLSESDIHLVLDYWFRSPREQIEAMGVDWEKFPAESVMRESLTEKCRANQMLDRSKLNALVVAENGIPVGFHTLFPYTEGESGVFHAHLFSSESRRRGIASQSYPLACRVFVDRFQLKKILFKTPTQNRGALRVKEKLGIRRIGEETIGFGIIRDGTRAEVFEWSKQEIDATLDRGSRA